MVETIEHVQVHPAFAEALRAERKSLNDRFAARQRAGARIDALALERHLATTVNDLAAQVASVLPERVRAVSSGLFDVSLDLFAAGLLGTETKHPHVAAAWREVLPAAARLLARDPKRIAACLSNAADQIAGQASARPEEWIAVMREVSPHCDSVPQWLDAGKVAAWRAGLVQYRSAALQILRELPTSIAARCLAAPEDLTDSEWHERLDRIEADRWYRPGIPSADEASRALRIVATTGGFRGFGGPCLRPPQATAADGVVWVTDGVDHWQLLSDLFGVLWYRVPAESYRPTARSDSKTTIDARGRVAWDGLRQEFAELAESSSFACDGQTLAVTLPTSHQVFLVALWGVKKEDMAPVVYNNLLAQWTAQWPAALEVWSRFVQLHEPTWCFTPKEEAAAHLAGSFAMIRLVDHSIVISLRKVVEAGLEGFAKEIMAHEIGHHVYCPADLTDNARMLARMRVGLPTKEHLAPFISNLYSDLLINDRLERSAGVDISGVYLKLGSTCTDRLWTFYMRIYELLWKLDRGKLARGEIDARLNQDAQLGARLVRSYAKDWLDGAGRFAALSLPYLLEDEAARTQQLMAIWLDTRSAGNGAIPDGLTEIDDAELSGAIHPADDPDLSGVEASPPSPKDPPRGQAGQTGIKSAKSYRQPIEYAEVLKAVGVDIDPAELTARYYRELALPHLIRFPVRKLPSAIDPLPEGLDVWDVGMPLDEVDWLGTLLDSPQIIPGVTTRKRLHGTSPGIEPETIPVDLYLGIDCSGSMGNPALHLSYPVLAGAIIALSALRAGSCVKVVLSGEPGRTTSTPGFERNAATVLRTLTSYLGAGMSFGIHRLAETFAPSEKNRHRLERRPVHILIVSDNDMFSMLDSASQGRSGWDIARESLVGAHGGTFVLELPEYVRSSQWAQKTTEYLERIRQMGWNVSIVSSMEELVAFARQFSRGHFGDR